jgi:hypothetical protein
MAQDRGWCTALLLSDACAARLIAQCPPTWRRLLQGVAAAPRQRPDAELRDGVSS